ncbi:MAG: SpoIIE family protein phosphatase [Hespellia sp.]|jgi:stage II sporulation protein E|nr:SpoIIE family protein phosphatase [Hespellia sp.]
MKDGQVLHASPYVVQIEKYAHSLKQLSHTFLELEEKKRTFTSEEIELMFQNVKGKVCEKCEKCAWCWGENFVHTYQMGYEILSAVESYGSELNIETKRKLQQRCVMAPRFLRETLEVFRNAKQTMLWKNRMIQSRKGCAIQMDTFADAIRSTAKELEDSIYVDERMEKRMIAHLKKENVRVLCTTFFMTKEGKYKVQMIARSMRNSYSTVSDVAKSVSAVFGKRMVPIYGQGQTVGKDYSTLIFVEGPVFYTMQGVAKIGKGCENISGDSFMLLELPEGRQSVALSDGMGSGEKARKESELVIELLEELLEAGFPPKTAIQMINTTLVMGREEIHFSTVDMSVFDLYTGACEIIKAGASSTFIRHGEDVEHLSSTSLPIGVLHTIDVDSAVRTLSNGDFVIMVTDGVLDALPVGEQDIILETIIQGTVKNNPKEMAHHILEQVLAWTGEAPMDDMTVLTVGIWNV